MGPNLRKIQVMKQKCLQNLEKLRFVWKLKLQHCYWELVICFSARNYEKIKRKIQTWYFLRFNLRFIQFEAIAENELTIKSLNQSFFKLQTNKITDINLRNTWKNLKLKTDKKPSCFQTWKNHRFEKYPKLWKVDLQAEINSPIFW